MQEDMPSLEAVFADFRLASEALGVVRCLWFLPAPAHAVDRHRTEIWSWEFDPQWVEQFRRGGLPAPKLVDTLIGLVKLTQWKEIIAGIPDNEEMRAMVAQFVDLHGDMGFVLPVFGPNGHQTLLAASFATELTGDDDPRLAELSGLASLALRQIAMIRHDNAKEWARLSARELDVVRELATGKSKKNIALALDIAPSTVDTYSRRIFLKLDARDRVEAVVKALALGLISI